MYFKGLIQNMPRSAIKNVNKKDQWYFWQIVDWWPLFGFIAVSSEKIGYIFSGTGIIFPLTLYLYYIEWFRK